MKKNRKKTRENKKQATASFKNTEKETTTAEKTEPIIAKDTEPKIAEKTEPKIAEKTYEIKKESVTLLDGTDILKNIEYCGRVCYNSVNKIEDGSAERFIKMIVGNGHNSVIEHGTVSFFIEQKNDTELTFSFEILNVVKGMTNAHMKITKSEKNANDKGIMISGNLTAWSDFIYTELAREYKEIQVPFALKLSELYPIVFKPLVFDWRKGYTNYFNLTVPTKDFIKKHFKKHQYFSFEIVCPRFVSHQLVRHRIMSFSQESQRYCNYSKEKNGGKVPIILPFFSEKADLKKIEEDISAETDAYMRLVNSKEKAEVARGLLPICTATKICISGFRDDWEAFVEKRNISRAQAEIRFIASEIDKILKKN